MSRHLDGESGGQGAMPGAPSSYYPTAARWKRTEAVSTFRERMHPDIAKLAGQGLTLRAIAIELNHLGLPEQ